MSEDLGCTVYINSDKTRDELVLAIANIAGGNIRRRTIETPFIEIDVFENDDFDEQRMKSTDNGFLFFPYYLEIGTPQDVIVDSVEYKFLVKQLLVMVFEHGGSAVLMCCDYQEELLGINQVGQLDWTRYWRA
jgi:hypothetical protein